jgi:hypothetical protein
MTRILSLFCVLVVSSSVAAWGQTPEFPVPQKEHQWLEQFAGKWTSQSKSIAFGEQPAMECSGEAQARLVGKFWIVLNLKGQTAGQTFTAVQTIGYSPSKEKYIGTWIDSMTDHLWRYEGSVDESGKKLSLTAMGPNFMTGEGQVKYRDSYEFASSDRIVTTSEIQGEDGKWITFMTGEMTRTQ